VRRLTIVDIAREANVSIKTVSRVLNRETGVGAQTRDRVEAIIKAYNFKPNASARALPSSRSYMIGMLVRTLFFGHYYYNGLQSGVMKSCRSHGYHMMVETAEDFDQDREGFTRRLRGSHFDGVLVSPPLSDNPEILALLESMDMPYLRISPTIEFDRAPYVFMNDPDASYKVVEHLWELGHRQIAYIGFADTGASRERHEGYLRFFQDKGLPPPYALHELKRTTSQTAFEAGEAILSRPDRPTAIFAGTDFLALGVMAAASKLGLKIPTDLSLVGFDNSPGTESVWPPLTTIHQPIIDIGHAAADMLIRRLGGEMADKSQTTQQLDFELIQRASTAAPRAV
jgi:LacI family transcriptional regulator